MKHLFCQAFIQFSSYIYFFNAITSEKIILFFSALKFNFLKHKFVLICAQLNTNKPQL